MELVIMEKLHLWLPLLVQWGWGAQQRSNFPGLANASFGGTGADDQIKNSSEWMIKKEFKEA